MCRSSNTGIYGSPSPQQTQTVIANEVKQSMSRLLHRCEVVGFRQSAAWIATGLTALAMTVWGVLCMYLVGFKVRVPFQPHRNSQLAMTVWEESSP